MENVLYKIFYPAEFHVQTAVEAGMLLYLKVGERIGEIDRIIIETQEAGLRIIDKTGPLDNPADRGRLRRRRCVGPAHRRTTRPDGGARKRALHQGLR